jgi:hypothetical protein
MANIKLFCIGALSVVLSLNSGCNQKSPTDNPPTTDKNESNKVEVSIVTVGQGEDLEKFNDQLPTSQGLLSLKKIGKEDFERPDLYLGDKIILAAKDVDDDRIGLVRRFKLTQGEAILVSTDAGGSGTLPSYSILLLLKGQAPKWLNKDDFYSETGDITYTQKGDVVTIGLGINDKGLNKSIVLENGQLLTNLLETAKGGLPDRDCKWLHDELLPNCEQQPPEDCNKHLISESSKVITRSLGQIRLNPNFNEQSVAEACYQACSKQPIPDYKSFKKSVCGG